MIIDICGIDGCGKSTQANLLSANIQSKLKQPCKVIHGFKPRTCAQSLSDLILKSNTDYYNVSSDLRTFSFIADLFINSFDNISSEIKKGNIVILEKYYSDTLIYAPLLGSRKDVIEKICDCLPKPDIAFYLDISPKSAVERIYRRGKIIAEKEGEDYAIKARNAYRAYYKNESKIRPFYFIDGEENIDEISSNIFNIYRKFLLDERYSLIHP